MLQKRRQSRRTPNKNAPRIQGVVTLPTSWNFSSRRRGLALRRASRRIHKILEFFARLKERNFLRRHVHFLPGLRIAPDAATALPGAEAAEPANLDFVALLQRVNDALENRFHDRFRLLPWKLGHPEHFLDQIGLRERRLLCHRSMPL